MADVCVVGAGPNGLAAAITLAREGLDVHVYEGADEVGGASRTITDPEFETLHDWGAAVHPMAFASPFFQDFGLEERVEFAVPEISYAQATEPGHAGIAWRDLDRTVEGLGGAGKQWHSIFAPLIRHADELARAGLGSPLTLSARHLLRGGYAPRVAQFVASAVAPGSNDGIVKSMLAGSFAHSATRLASPAAQGPGLLLALLAHARGWPIPVGGSGQIAAALAAEAMSLGVRITTGTRINSLNDLEPAHAHVLDVSPREALRIANSELSPRYRRNLLRAKPGLGVSKVDFVLSEPIPWLDERVGGAGTVHMGRNWDAMDRAMRELKRGRHPDDPFVLLSQPTTFDPSRAPKGRHVVWAYTHAPNNSPQPATDAIVAKIEAHAPGFRDTILSAKARTPQETGRQNPTMPGGDFASSALNLRQLFIRPVLSSDPWRAGESVFMCSGATTPGPGVHGMSGYNAAMSVIRHVFR